MSDSFASSQSDKSYTDVRGDSREGGGGGGVSSGNRPAIPHRSSLNLSLAGSTSSLATYKQHHSIPQALKCIPQCSESVYHIAGLVDDRGGRFEKYRKTKEELDGIRNKKVRRFYERQNAILDGFAEGAFGSTCSPFLFPHASYMLPITQYVPSRRRPGLHTQCAPK